MMVVLFLWHCGFLNLHSTNVDVFSGIDNDLLMIFPFRRPMDHWRWLPPNMILLMPALTFIKCSVVVQFITCSTNVMALLWASFHYRRVGFIPAGLDVIEFWESWLAVGVKVATRQEAGHPVGRAEVERLLKQSRRSPTSLLQHLPSP